MKLADYPDLDNLAARWFAIAARHPRPTVGTLVRIIGKGVSGVVLSDSPMVVRDGRGVEHEVNALTVRSVFA